MLNLSKTFFIPLYFKYKESITSKRIYDKDAVTFFQNNINTLNINFDDIDSDTQSFERIIARTLAIDSFLLETLSIEKTDFILNAGCGLDFRNRRLDITAVPWYNLDLPEVIEFRNSISSPVKNEFSISGNILESDTLSGLPKGKGIFIFEGLLMFFERDEIISLLKNIKRSFPDSFYIIHTFPETDSEISSLNSISKNIIKWRNNTPAFFEENIGIKYITGKNLEKPEGEVDFKISLFKDI